MNVLGIDSETKQDLVSQYTNGRETKSSEMHFTECQALINDLRAKVNEVSPQFKREDRQRKKVIALLCKIGYVKNDKPDMNRINDWCYKYGNGHTSLTGHKGAELNKLVTQADNMYKDFIKDM